MLAGRDHLEYPLGTALAETVGWISHPRVSPRGDAVAFIDHPNWPEDAGSVVMVDRAGKRAVLADGWSSAQGLVWAPSGSEVWFTAAPNGRARALYAVSLAGRVRLIRSAPGSLTLQDIARDGSVLLTRDALRYETTVKAPGAAREQDMSWLDGSLGEALSTDGRRLLFYEGGEAGGASYGVYVRPTDGGSAVRLGEGLPTSLSPDGKWALTIRRNNGSELVMLPTGAGEPRVLPRLGISEHLWGFWLPDGTRLVVNGAEPGKGLRSYLQEIDGEGGLKALTPEGLWAANVSPDGTLLAAVSTGQPVSLVPLAGGSPQPVTGSLAGDRPAQWSADGRSLYVFRRDELPCRVYRLGLDRGERELWKELIPADPAGVVAIHEVLITPDASAYAYGYVRWLSDLYLVEGLQ
jgi:Tol biopolymer transport system component